MTIWVAVSASLPEFRPPFECGRTYLVSQAHDGVTHQHRDFYAWDFRMPEGTPVVAARDGVVRKARGDSISGGCHVRYARDANYVVVSHENGLETQYLHLSSVVVREGDVVREGQLLGHSGRTGWACGAHLHFKVARRESDSWNNPSVPARLKGHGDAPRGTWVFTEACRVASWRQILDSSRKQISSFPHGQDFSSSATGRTSSKSRSGNTSVRFGGP